MLLVRILIVFMYPVREKIVSCICINEYPRKRIEHEV